MILKLLRVGILVLFLAPLSIITRDLIFEFKTGAFLPVDCDYRNIYGTASVFYNPEFTLQVVEEKPWYIFMSAAYTSKEGNSIGFCTPTKVEIIPLGLGLKYFFPFRYGNFYLGLGWQPAYLRTFNCSDFVARNTAKWGQGGIGKFGVYFDLPHNFRIDLFADYSFVNVGCGQGNCCDTSCVTSCATSACCPVQNSCCSDNFIVPVKANISGGLLGIGIGYCF